MKTPNTNTPLTDAFANQLRGLGTGYYQALDFARELERKLNEANEVNQKYLTRIQMVEEYKINDQLRARIVELEKDKALIDGLERLIQNENDLDICQRKDGYWVTEIFNQQHPDNKPYPTLRLAIDQAMLKKE